MSWFAGNNGIVRTAEFALAAGCALTAFGFGGDLALLVTTLLFGVLTASAGIVATPFSLSRRILLSFAVLAIFAAEGGLLYWHAHLARPIEIGALIRVQASRPAKLANGRYSFPIQITNVSDIPVMGFQLNFVQRRYAKVLGPSDEQHLMTEVEEEIRNDKITPSSFPDEVGQLGPHVTITMWNPGMNIDERAYDDMMAGRSLMYYAVVVVFADPISKNQRSLFYAASCMHTDADTHDVLECEGFPSFERKAYLFDEK